MSNPPNGGRGTKKSGPGEGKEAGQEVSPSGDEKTETPRRSRPRSKSQARTRQAISEAQQGLQALLHPQTDDTHPRVISPSGATRSRRQGRVAGPSAAVRGIAPPPHAQDDAERLLPAPRSTGIVPSAPRA